jgi:hypothetical protein
LLKKEKGEIEMKNIAKCIATLLIAVLFVGVLPAFAGYPNEPTNAISMWIEPSPETGLLNFTTATVSVGYTFDVIVWTNTTGYVNSSGLPGRIGGWQFKMLYNNAYLDAIGCGYTNTTAGKSQFFEKITTMSVLPTFGSYDLTRDYVQHGESWLSGPVRGPGYGSLSKVTFNVTAVPPKGGTIESLLDIKTCAPGDTYILDFDSTANFLPLSGVYNSAYKLTWAPPPPARMAVEHDGFYGTPPASMLPPNVWPLYYGPYPPPAVNSSFDVKVYIEDLSAAWYLTNASFCLCYNTTVIDVIGGTANITLNTAVWNDTTSVITVTHGTPDEINFTVYPKAGVVPSGKVLVATVKFTIMIQQACPPYPSGYYDFSKLTFCGVDLEDHTRAIDTTTPKEGEVRILAIVALPMPWLEVQPKDTVLETEPCHTVLVGTEFDINITVKDLHEKWYVVGYQFRLTFDPTLLELVSVTEGPFLTDSRWNLHGTFFVSGEETDGMFGHHIWAGGILLPNDTGDYDQTIYPSAPGPDVPDLDPPVDPVLATIRFKAIKQECFGGANLTCALDLLPFWLPENQHFVDVDGNYIPTDTPKIVNGTYTIMPMYQYGRIIDVYGGAVNRGYGTAHGTSYKGIGVVWPSSYGGQGVGGNMDLVLPQSVVYLFAYVTYNCWPVQSKDVGFEIEGPYEQKGWTPENPVERDVHIVRKYSNRTSTGDCEDPGGVAWIMFQMPWPCDNPEDYLGKYRVTATVEICGVVVTDVLWFDYYYLVEITKVTTDKTCYPHCNDVVVTIEFRSKAQQKYPVLFAVVLQDELETPVSYNYYALNVSGADFCHWKEYDPITVTVHVEKWAFAGIGHIYVSAFDWDPTDISPITGQHGAPWLPTYGLGWPLDEQGVPVPLPEICIYPY